MSKRILSCKACFAYGEKDVRVEQRELEYDENDVLVKVERGGICGSDIHYYQHGRAGMSILKHPMVVGHEFVGTLSQVPAGSALRVGQKVAINPSQPCNHCEYCLAGKQNLCATMRFMGSAQFNPHVDGGFSEYVVATEQQCIPYRDDVFPQIMAFAEPLAVAIHAVNVAGTLVGKRVLVIGAGPIGCLILAAPAVPVPPNWWLPTSVNAAWSWRDKWARPTPLTRWRKAALLFIRAIKAISTWCLRPPAARRPSHPPWRWPALPVPWCR